MLQGFRVEGFKVLGLLLFLLFNVPFSSRGFLRLRVLRLGL